VLASSQALGSQQQRQLWFAMRLEGAIMLLCCPAFNSMIEWAHGSIFEAKVMCGSIISNCNFSRGCRNVCGWVAHT
jgi:hypothetical protein